MRIRPGKSVTFQYVLLLLRITGYATRIASAYELLTPGKVVMSKSGDEGLLCPLLNEISQEDPYRVQLHS